MRAPGDAVRNETAAFCMLTGYLHPDYARSLSEFGEPLYLPRSQGWLLKRAIPGTSFYDAMSCYPLFCCSSWGHLAEDLAELADELLSITIVADPFGDYDPELLRGCFDRAHAYKDHFVVATGRPFEAFVRASHRAHARRALRALDVELCESPIDRIDDWMRLYSILAERHSITGLRRFSRRAFEIQLEIPGMVMFRAAAQGRTVGLDLWYLQGDCAQGHLAAFDATAYELRASYATKWRVLEYFDSRAAWVNLGAGQRADASDGLSAFKRGFATGTKPAWLCGRVLQAELYAELSRARGIDPDDPYFPAYRKGEF